MSNHNEGIRGVAERRTGTAQTVRQALQQRGAEATRELRETLHLSANLNDTTILGTALASAAVREIRRNPQFAEDVRREYDELAQLSRPTGKRGQPKTEELPPLIPIAYDESTRHHIRVDPYAPPDVPFLIRVYGTHQLARALQEYTLDDLKRASAIIEAKHPGTKPTSRAKKQAVIDYIVKYSTAE